MAFLLAFAVYWFTLAPTVWVGDSGELIAAAHQLGIPHPTGYPLWLLLTKAFATIVPIGSFAWRANLFSALCAAGAAQLLASTLRALGVGRAAALGGGLALAWLAPIWGEATVARTYPLAALLTAAVLARLARWIDEPRDRRLVECSLLLGFGLANHPMVIALAPALLAVVAGRRPADLRRPKLWGATLLALAPGLLVYAYLPWRAAADPPLEYRAPMVPGGGAAWAGQGPKELRELTELPALESYLARDLHQQHHWAESAADHATILGHHLKELGRELTPLGVLFALLGAIALWRGGERGRRRSLLAAIVLLWLGNLAPLALHGAWWDIFLYSRYLTTGFVGVALLVGVGIDVVVRAVAARIARPAAARIAGGAIALALPALLLAVNGRACDRREAWLAEDYGRALLAELPKDAQFLSGSDSSLYPLFTLHFVEGLRPDVQLVSPLQLIGDPELLLAWRAQRRGQPVAASVRPAFTTELDPGRNKFEGLESERHGLLSRLRIPGTPAEPLAPYEAPRLRGLERDDEPDPFARSLIGAIEADLADAALVRGDREQARRRLERVARLRAPRSWGGYVTGIVALQKLAGAEAAGGRRDLAVAELELASRLASVALECGDPRDRTLLELSKELQRQLGLARS